MPARIRRKAAKLTGHRSLSAYASFRVTFVAYALYRNYSLDSGYPGYARPGGHDGLPD
jgi:hypothetical protein